MKKFIFLLVIGLISFPLFLEAQSIQDWTTYTSARTINDIVIDDQKNIWSATSGGVLLINDDGSIVQYTTKEGLSRLDGTSIIYDSIYQRIIIGYINGVLDVILPAENEILTIRDIERNQNYTSKGINDFQISDGKLYTATDFGIVVYNLENLFVEDSFIQFGDFTRATAVNDIFITADSIYAVTAEGIGVGNLSDELAVNTNWSNINSENSPIETEISTIGYRDGQLFASSVDENFIRDENGWNTFNGFGDTFIEEFVISDGIFSAFSSRSIYIYNDSNGAFVRTRADDPSLTIQSIWVDDGQIYSGTANNGVAIIEQGTGETEIIETGGPYQNYFSDLKFDGEVLIAASTNESARNSAIDNPKGYYIFDDEGWKNFNQNTNQEIDSFGYQQAFTTAITSDYYYFGSWGRGIARHNKQDNTVRIFDETNSTLRGWVDNNDQFPVMSGLQTDSNGDVWAVSRFGDTPLYYQSPGDEDWIPLPKANAATNADEYYGLFIDSFDQKWITLQNTSAAGNGLIVMRTGSDPANTSDDESVKLTEGSNSGNLPDNKVNAIIQDKEGEVWIGTGRGIARFIFPELIIDGGPQEREAQWLINEDTTASSRFLLRDVNVSAMAVNAANQKWIGSENQGIWVLNAEGSSIIQRFTTENSPLFSNSIRSIAINDETGEVFIATDIGLISYRDIPKAPVSSMDELKVFPNPFSYKRHSRIVIEGLSEETTIKIAGVDGTVVQEIEVRGGRTEWNGLDYNGNQLGSGVYFVIAYEGSSRQTGLGKVVIVR